MRDVLLINPNTSAATTAMMVAIARKAAPADMRIRGATAPRGAPMILDDAMLAASVSEVLALARRHAATVDGIVIAAFGDPGLAALRSELTIPVVGIAESAMLTAAAGGRRFGVATVTPGLAGAIAARAAALGLAASYTGIRLTDGDPQALAAQTDRLIAALAEAVERCIAQDGAQAVIIGGGPLGRAAIALAPLFDIPIIAPIPAAIRRLVA
jgi:Asp/Glu/hydantoin racemase